MVITQEGKEYPVHSAVIHESIDLLCSELKVNTILPLYTDKPISIKGFPSMYAVGATVQNGILSYTLYPESYVKLLYSIFPEMHKECTTESLLQNLGFDVAESTVKSNPVKWNVPSGRWKTVAQYVSENTSVPSGGGALVYISLDGKAHLIDLKSAMEGSTELTLEGTVEKTTISDEWMASTPGKVKYYFYTEKGTETGELLLLKDRGEAVIRQLCNTDNIQQTLNLVTNVFYKNYYQTQQVSLTDVFGETSKIALGKKTKFKKSEFLIKEYFYSFGEEGHPQVSVVLCANAAEDLS